MKKFKKKGVRPSEDKKKPEEDAPEGEFSEELLHEGGETPDVRLKKIEEIFQTEDGMDLELSRLLWQVHANKDYATLGYDEFEDYVEQRLGFKKRKGLYYVSIWQKFRVELGLEQKKLGRIGWWKASIIRPIVSLDNHEEWLNKARTMKSRELQDAVRKALGKEKSELKSFIVKLADDQFVNVEAAVKQAMREANTDAKGHALDLIATEFQANRMEPEDKPGWLMSQFERTYGCRILAMDPDVYSQVKEYAQTCIDKLNEEKKVLGKERVKEAVAAVASAPKEEAPTKKSKKLERLKALAKKPEEESSEESEPTEEPTEGAVKVGTKKKKKKKFKLKHREAEATPEESDDVSEGEAEAETPEKAGV